MNTPQYTTTNTTRRDAHTANATYGKIVAAIEARSKRLEAGRQATAEFLATLGVEADGDIIFAA